MDRRQDGGGWTVVSYRRIRNMQRRRTAPPEIATIVAAIVPAMRPWPGREETGTIPNTATESQAFSPNF